MPPDPAEVVESLLLRARLRRAREARGLPVEPRPDLSDDERRDVERAAAHAEHLIERIEIRRLRDRLHLLRRDRARSAPVSVAEPVAMEPLVDEVGVERRRALPPARPVEPEPVSTASSVRSMLASVRTVQNEIGGRVPRAGGRKR